ncbi:MAG: hypothetical protein AAGM67_07370, partial [Bacteroidota bacterium]
MFPLQLREKIAEAFYICPSVTPMKLRETLFRFGYVLDDQDFKLLRSNLKTLRERWNSQEKNSSQRARVLDSVPHEPNRIEFLFMGRTAVRVEQESSRSATSAAIGDLVEWCERHSLISLLSEDETDQFTSGVLGYCFT